ncbi:glycerol-3-phosphate dehydrogenase [Oceanibacterium hippocampi]|uniref:Glycerol-3-phosphate dehydrogenase n=1 Tax=Oceanibacterium hippocampi TaxID=745714 RepID=A0A1Y5RXS4_9PROT|nr:glycerol-3-phosphate dehydrogenase [Oceanibacterium hippocampi]SLN27436.1 Aerobic glycerol-3-phosphate dehydrogenase [Oceanibacterium hippocampi]
MEHSAPYDLFIIGGGINGAGIARDAAGRGLSVMLCEMNDLASATSSASTKLIHGGLRYLEYYEFRLVREALEEREVLLRAAPHIIWPLRFVLPHNKGLRPAWMIRLGLFLYDHLGGRKLLPASRSIRFRAHPAGAPLKDGFTRGFVYSDCWVQDSRLVVLNALDAKERGATILTRTECVTAQREAGLWVLTIRDRETGEVSHVRARGLVNAAGPWVARVLKAQIGSNRPVHIRLVKGSHVIVPRMFEHENAYIFQNPDGRVIFAVPYEGDFTLIGTTDEDYQGELDAVDASPAEIAYLCDAVNEYFRKPITPADVVASYAGVRPLFGEEDADAAAVSRDYKIELDDASTTDAPLLNVFGGKLTTYRRLAESAMEHLAPLLAFPKAGWTDTAALPGGDIADADFDGFLGEIRREFPWLGEARSWRLARNYGTRIREIIGDAGSPRDLGRDFGGGLTEAEVEYLMRHEWARTAEDVLWRRSKMKLHCPETTANELDRWMAASRRPQAAARMRAEAPPG